MATIAINKNGTLGIMENQRLAVNTGVTLSSNLISACLSMIAIIGAIFLFVIEKREVGWLFYFLISLSFIMFIFSIISGGKGIDIARKKAYQDILDLDFSKSKFNLQAIFCILGIFFCILSYVFTSEKVEKNDEIKRLNKNILKIIQFKENEKNETKVLFEKLKALENKINKLESEKSAEKKETVPNTRYKQFGH